MEPEAIESALDSLIQWPADMTYFITGQSEEWQLSQNSLLMAMALSVFLVYVIMASQFESLRSPSSSCSACLWPLSVRRWVFG